MNEIPKKDLILIRDFTQQDRVFITATWKLSSYQGNIFFDEKKLKRIKGHIKRKFLTTANKIIDFILQEPNVKVKVLCLKDSEDVILGYAVTDTFEDSPVLHYVFIREAWRGNGLAKDLLVHNYALCTHMTKDGRKLKDINFVPYLL